MSTSYFNGIVVGYDGSRASEAALEWAADEAQRRDLTLHVIHVWEPPPILAVSYGTPTMPDSETILDDGVLRATKVAPDVRIVRHALPAPVSAAFVDASVEAEAVVLGAHGHRRRSADLGSTAWQVAIHALSPVVIVRTHHEPGDSHRAIVVGVDGSTLSEQALEYAFVQAARRAAPLVAVHGWRREGRGLSAVPLLAREDDDPDRQHTDELATWVRPWARRYPQVAVRLVAREADPADALVDEAANAQLVVVGSRGRGGFRGLTLGSVGLTVMRAVDCPFVVARATRR